MQSLDINITYIVCLFVLKDALDAGYGRADTGYRKEPVMRQPESTRRRESLSVIPDSRFAQGTTTKSTFKELPSEAMSRQVFSDQF